MSGRHRLIAEGLLAFLGFVLIFVGARGPAILEASGGLLVGGATVLAFRTINHAQRPRKR